MQKNMSAGAVPRDVGDNVAQKAVTNTHQEAVAFMSIEQGF